MPSQPAPPKPSAPKNPFLPVVSIYKFKPDKAVVNRALFGTEARKK
jgi:hypothetical protein